MIKKASELLNTNTKIRMLIAGYPGIGKTTLALSAPKPLLVDADRGITRVSARHRTDGIVQPNTYQELFDDLSKSDLSDYETVVFDTGMALFNLMKYHVITMDSKNGKKDGSLSLQGYGAMGREFQNLIDYTYYKLHKHVVIVFHAKEEKDGDNVKLRILIEGQTKDNIWQCMDIGGFVEMENNSRVIQFQNCERFFAKRTYGIKDKYAINDLSSGGKNTFLTQLFNEIQENINNEQKEFLEQQRLYEEVMAKYDFEDKNIDINELMERIKNENHILTSERELKAKFAQKAKDGGYIYDKEQKKYILNDTQSA